MERIAVAARAGVAAGVVALASGLISAAPAQAEPAAPASTGSLGTAATVDGTSPWWLGRSNSEGAPTLSAASTAATPAQANLFWLGAPNPTPPDRTTLFSVNPVGLLPGAVQPLFGWFTALNLEACVAGLGVKVGPYGTVSASVARSC